MGFVRAIPVLAIAALLTGCGDKSDRLTVYAVKGTIAYDKKSPEGAMIVFHPLTGDAAGSPPTTTAMVYRPVSTR